MGVERREGKRRLVLYPGPTSERAVSCWKPICRDSGSTKCQDKPRESLMMRQLAAGSMIAAIIVACSSDQATQPAVTAQAVVPPPRIGVPATIERVDVIAGGSGASNSCYLTVLVARALDASGNVIRVPSIEWAIEDGPIKFVPVLDAASSSTVERDGRVWKYVGATGAVGVGRVRASLPNNGYSTIFTVNYTPAQYDITFTDSHRGKLHFESAQTCVGFNEPPVDTVPAGETVRWVNDDLSAMRLVSVGEPSFPDSPPIAYGESYTTVFSRPGTYRYTAENHPTLTGTIVVR
jgi:plastocyanin